MQTDGYYAAPYVLPYCRMDSLAVGGLLALLLRMDAGRPIEALRRLAWPLAAAAFAALAVWDRGDVGFVIAGYSVVAFASAAVTLRALTHEGGPLSRACSARWLVHIGKVSYGLYLLHLIARAGVDFGFGRVVPDWRRSDSVAHSLIRLAAISAVAVLMATISYYFFEKPILRLKDRWAPARESISRRDEARA
ncbi:MAG: acyltransferase [Planctomycetota bacterium]|nr:MAG: acyltransferase [Planctomycetota bacterium]